MALSKLNNGLVFWDTLSNAPIDVFFKDETIEEIESYSNFQEGWCYGEGNIISSSTISNAETIYYLCKHNGLGIEPHPEIEGTITLIAYLDDLFLEIEIDETENLKLRYAEGKGTKYHLINKKNIKAENLVAEIKELYIQWNKKFLFVPSTGIAVIPKNNNDFEAIEYLSPIKEASQFFWNRVQSPNQIQSVTT